MTTRSEHMQWCKDRANEYLKDGDHKQAWLSMVSDLGKHDETADHMAIQLGMMQLMSGGLKSVYEMRMFIDGFN